MTQRNIRQQMAQFDWILLFVTRAVRMFSYGGITLIFVLAMTEFLDASHLALLLTGILLGDLGISLFLTTHADRYGRRWTLLIGSVLKAFAGVGFASSRNIWVLLFTGIVGVISPSGGDMGPFIAVEQAALTQLFIASGTSENASHAATVTTVFAWYQLVGSLSLALGAFSAGAAVTFLHISCGYALSDTYRFIFVAYALLGLLKAAIYWPLSEDIESKITTSSPTKSKWVLGGMLVGLETDETRSTVAKLASLFSLDAFAGGLGLQSFIAWWFSMKWSLDSGSLGNMLLIANIMSGLSGLLAGKCVQLFGAINTMVFTHLPSNILLGLVPLMPTSSTSLWMLLARFSISQMDVPARQAYVSIVVQPAERSAAAGWTNSARNIGVSLAPLLLAYLSHISPDKGLDATRDTALRHPFYFSSPFILAGMLKCLYDVILYLSFRAHINVGVHTPVQSDAAPLTVASGDGEGTKGGYSTFGK